MTMIMLFLPKHGTCYVISNEFPWYHDKEIFHSTAWVHDLTRRYCSSCLSFILKSSVTCREMVTWSLELLFTPQFMK